jgi:hypothetical protein
MRDGVRVWDRDNQLARGLQNSVHGGDIWNEGIVWPRIAEISLLGALGCGKVSTSTSDGGPHDQPRLRNIYRVVCVGCQHFPSPPSPVSTASFLVSRYRR